MKKLTYLVPVDFSDCSYNALQYAIMLARFSEGHVMLCHVIDLEEVPESENPVVVTWSLDRLNRKAKEKMKSLLEMAEMEGVKVEEDIVMGNVKVELLKKVDRINPHVIVIGRNTDQQPRRDSVVTWLTRNTRVPVLVVPGSHSPKLPDRAVLATDMKPDKVAEFAPFLNIVRKTAQHLAILSTSRDWSSDGPESQALIEKLNAEYGIEASLVPQPKNGGLNTVVDFVLSNNIDLLCTIKRNKSFLGRLFNRQEEEQFDYNIEVPVLVINERL
jgi:nucleotide-binding universal stress UspA family protein